MVQKRAQVFKKNNKKTTKKQPPSNLKHLSSPSHVNPPVNQYTQITVVVPVNCERFSANALSNWPFTFQQRVETVR